MPFLYFLCWILLFCSDIDIIVAIIVTDMSVTVKAGIYTVTLVGKGLILYT